MERPSCRAVSLFFLLLTQPAWAGGWLAASGKADITPDLERERIRLAGYGAKGRLAEGVHDPLYARAVVVSDGAKTVALVSVDSIGLFREDVEALRGRLGWNGGERALFLSATHSHSAPDTLGLWGPFPGVSGVDSRYRARVLGAVEGLLRRLAGELEPVRLVAAKAELDPRGLCRDKRDPAVIDPELVALQFRSKKDQSIATVVRWSCHPEVLGKSNRLVSADFPGALCAKVEKETGGDCVFLTGMVGGLLTPDTDRAAPVEKQFDEARRVGESVAAAALAALKKGERIAPGPVGSESRLVRLPVENSRYLLFLRSLRAGHRLYREDGSPLPRWRQWTIPLRHLLLFPLPPRLRPWVETEVSLVRLGAVGILGLPGEPFPELLLGGYEGRLAFGQPLVKPDNPAPPDLAKAPKGPYLRGSLPKYGLIVGQANDEVGYFVPEYDFKAASNRAMHPRPAGDHYEETNSLGPRAAGLVLEAARSLLVSAP
ncbi:MAG TPA: hypothetical protein DCM05_10415 [Elusimicrobia bacterium]|nr:hypothetical protein [Elusimicrobiota bacterium]